MFRRIMNGNVHKVRVLSIGFIVAMGATAAFAQVEGDYQIQPIFTRYAETAKKITFNANAKVFNGVDLQEAVDYEGWGVEADLTVPIPYTKRFQVRLSWPFYTDGDARVREKGRSDTGQRIDIRGYGGTFEFPNLQLEYQVLTEEQAGFNLGAYGGYGEKQRSLWTTSFDDDVYNHDGTVIPFGLKADWRHGEQWRFVANAGARHYRKSDDLNPAGVDADDRFWLGDVSVAAIYRPWDYPIYPVGELVYQGNFDDYHSVLAVPEFIWAVCRNFELKVGVPIGLTDDGESIGGRLQATLRF
jgi:hypothetical protein